jgi:hypothetical protein
MTNKLTDAQVALLRSGLERADHCVVAPTGKAASVKKSAAKMIDAGWLKDIRAKPGSPVWRTDAETGTSYSLKLTAAGLKVIPTNDFQGTTSDPTPSTRCDDEGEDRTKAPALKTEGQDAQSLRPSFREGSKLAGVVAMLAREGGVTIDELSAVMNWLPHSTRAVLTGLRKRGVLVARRKMPDGRASAYVIEADLVSASGQG